MGTQAIIAVKTTKGYTSVTVNYDGDTLLSTLSKYYDTSFKARELVNYGNISTLGKRIHPIGEHSFNNREDGTTTYYHRDRGEKLFKNTYRNQKQMFDFIKSMCCDYVYYFNGKEWKQAKNSQIK